MTHDYKRNGTTTLFAALCTLTGHVISTCMPRHRHQEWIKFLALIDREVATDFEVHLICDNYATHNHAKVQRWLHRHPRFHVHFTPTSASWLNMVERFFRDLTDKRIRRGIFRNVQEVRRDRRVRLSPQRRPEAVHLDQEGIGHSRKSHASKSHSG